MRDRDAETRDERPRLPRDAGGGTSDSPRTVRQTRAACAEIVGDETMGLMEKVLRRENLREAYQRVVRNGGAPGVDGMTVEELMPYCREHWPRIRESLQDGTYMPQPVRRVEIPKPGGGMRMLGIPTVLDRMIQQAVLQVLTPIFDPTFSDASFGYRPGRSAHGAVERAREHVTAGYRWVVDVDLEAFFDRVQHDVLMARVARRVRDKQVLRLLRRYLQAGVMIGGITAPRTEGTPQGGPLSPLLSNILLDDLDKELERRGHRFVRYADDCNVYVRSEKAGHRVMGSLEQFLRERLRLHINRNKSAVARPWSRKFLGYSFTSHHQSKLKVARESAKRLKTKLRTLMRRGRGQSLVHVIERVNQVVRGWASYYKLAQVKGTLEELDTWIRRKLRCIVWRQWKTARTRFRKLMAHGVSRAKAAHAAWGAHGPWRSAASSAMNVAIPNQTLTQLGLVSLLAEHHRLASLA